jgi:SAM-dependent methyltransferase
MSELLLGCGFSRSKLLGGQGDQLIFKDLITLDFNRKCEPDLVCNLDFAWPQWEIDYALTENGLRCLDETRTKMRDNFFAEVHAYEVLEHLGSQGDAAAFFNTFSNIHRLLVPGGHLFATVPSRHSPWAWGDPSHRRLIQQESLVFLDQARVAQNRARGTQMSDFSDLWSHNFKIVASSDDHIYHKFCLQAVK